MLPISLPVLVLLFLSSPAPSPPAPGAGLADGVEVRVQTTSVPLHAAPRGENVSAIYDAVVQFLARLPESAGVTMPSTGGPVEVERARHVVQLLDDKIRLDAGGSTLIGVVDASGAADWRTIDPRTNRVVNTGGTFNRELAQETVRSLRFPGLGDAETVGSSVTPTSQYKTIAGHRARRYDYWQQLEVDLDPDHPLTGTPVFVVTLRGEAWVAVDGPFLDDRRVQDLFRIHAWSMAGRSYGIDSEFQRFRRLGMVLAAKDSTVVLVGRPVVGGIAADELLRASESMRVTSIEAADVDPQRFEALEQEAQGCNCSCRNFERLQEIGAMPHDQREAQPDAMALAMCAPRCGMDWMLCQSVEDDY